MPENAVDTLRRRAEAAEARCLLLENALREALPYVYKMQRGDLAGQIDALLVAAAPPPRAEAVTWSPFEAELHGPDCPRRFGGGACSCG